MSLLLPFCWLALLVFYPQPAAPETSLPIAPIEILFKSGDGGLSWQGMGKGLPPKIQPINIWADEDELYMGAVDGLYKGNTALPYVKWEKEMLVQNEITGIFPAQYGAYAVSQWAGLFKNEPLTGQWLPLQEQLKDKNIHTVLESSTKSILVSCESGIYRSVNKGETWQQILDKGPVNKLIESEGVLICCSPSGLWRSTDAGNNWSRTLTSITGTFTVDVIGKVLVSIAPGQELGGIRLPNIVYQSADHGLTWKPVNQAWPAEMNSVYRLSQGENFLIACSDNQIFRSVDNGVTWTSVFKHGDPGNFFRLSVSGKTIYALLIQGC